MSRFSQMLDEMNVPVGKAAHVQVPLCALTGNPQQLTNNPTPLKVTVLRHATKMAAPAARKTPQPAAAPAAAQAPRKTRGIRLSPPRKLFGQAPRKPAARGTWTAEAIGSNVLQAR